MSSQNRKGKFEKHELKIGFEKFDKKKSGGGFALCSIVWPNKE